MRFSLGLLTMVFRDHSVCNTKRFPNAHVKFSFYSFKNLSHMQTSTFYLSFYYLFLLHQVYNHPYCNFNAIKSINKSYIYLVSLNELILEIFDDNFFFNCC